MPQRKKDENIGKAEAEKEARIATSLANSIAVKGENEAKITIIILMHKDVKKEAEALENSNGCRKSTISKSFRRILLSRTKAETARAERNVLLKMPTL